MRNVKPSFSVLVSTYDELFSSLVGSHWKTPRFLWKSILLTYGMDAFQSFFQIESKTGLPVVLAPAKLLALFGTGALFQ